MKYYFVFLFICLAACKQKDKSSDKGSANNTIPKIRSTVNKKSVASYAIPMGDPRLERKFGVEIYETPYTFKYLLLMQYDAMVQTDTLRIPDFDIWPTVKVEPGKEKFSCIIGFMDKENKFREYKMLIAKNDELKLIVLQGYSVSEY